MRLRHPTRLEIRAEKASVLVIVLWIAFGLVALTLYFASSMNFEYRAADNRVAGLESDQAIEGAVRYVSYVLANYATNGAKPDPTLYANRAVPVGDAHFWLIGRDTTNGTEAAEIVYGLVDEGAKLNLNTATSNMLLYLPHSDDNLVTAVLDWRDTNGGSGAFQSYYAMQHPAYQNKSAAFETPEELRMLYGMDMDMLVGEDLNRNGVLDPDEADLDKNGQFNPGLLEYVTVFSREPGTYSNGVPRVDIRTVNATGPFRDMLVATLGQTRADSIIAGLGLSGAAPQAQGRNARAAAPRVTVVNFATPLSLYVRCQASPINMTSDEFAQIFPCITARSDTNYIQGRININTASAEVLACLPGISDTPDLAQTLVDYRSANGDKLGSPAWLVDALGSSDATTLQTLASVDCVTTQSYQFTADIAAVGHHGRGYRRTRFVFDTCDGTPRIKIGRAHV